MDLALFDFDGTITDRDCFVDFVRATAPKSRRVVGSAALLPMVAGFRAGIVSVSSLRRAVCRVAYTGVPVAPVAEAGRRFAADEIPRRIRPFAEERLAFHRTRGDVIAVVSASLDLYLQPWCDARGIRLLCSRLQTAHGRFTGRYSGRDCGGQEKARQVRAHFDLARFGAVHAYGDTPDDDALLALAGHRFYRGRPDTRAQSASDAL